MKKKMILLVMPMALTLTSLKAMDTRIVAVPSKPKKMYSEVVQPEMPRHLNPEALLTMQCDDPDLKKALKSATKTSVPSTVARVSQYRRLKALSLNPNLTVRHDFTDLSDKMATIEQYLNQTEGVEKTEQLLAGLKTTEQIDLSKTLLLHRQNLQAQDVLLDSQKEAHAIQEKQKAQEAAAIEQANRRTMLLAKLTKLEQERQQFQTEKQKDQKRIKQLESTERIVYQNQQFATKAEEEYKKQKTAVALQSYIQKTRQDCLDLEKMIASLNEQQTILELLQSAGQSLDDAEWQERKKSLKMIKNQIDTFSKKLQNYQERIARAERGENPISTTSSSAFQPLITAALEQIRKPHDEQEEKFDEPLQFATSIDESAQVAQVSYKLDTIALSGLPLNDEDVQSALVTLEETKNDIAPLHLGMALLYAHTLLMNSEVQRDLTLKSKVAEYLEHYKGAFKNPSILRGLETLTHIDNNQLDLTASKMFKNDRDVMDVFMKQLEELKASQTQTHSPLSEIQNTESVVIEQAALLARAQITNDYLLKVAEYDAQIKKHQEELGQFDSQLSTLQAQQAAETTNDAERTKNIKKLEGERKAAEDASAKVTAKKIHLQEEYLKALESQTPQSSTQKKEVSWFWKLLGY